MLKLHLPIEKRKRGTLFFFYFFAVIPQSHFDAQKLKHPNNDVLNRVTFSELDTFSTAPSPRRR